MSDTDKIQQEKETELMKGIKKLLTGILAATMIMGASMTAFAAEDTQAPAQNKVSITIENELKEGADGVKKITYNYYQFMEAEVISLEQNGTEQSGTAVYYVEDETLANALVATKLFTSTKAASKDRWYIAAVEGVTADNIVEALNTDEMKGLAIATGNFTSDDSKKATATGLNPGYYLVISSLGTKAALQTLENVTIKEKNEDTTVTKTENKDVDAMFDNEIEYTITIKVPEAPAKKDIKVVDTATAGLTLGETVSAKAVKEGEADVDLGSYSWSAGKETSKDNKKAFEYELSIPAEKVVASAGKSIVLTYKAEVNEKAVVYVSEQNTAYIVYDNNKSAETVPVKVKTLGIQIIKFTKNGDEEKRLTGAEFTLWDAEKNGNKIAHVKETLADGKEGYRLAKEGEKAVDRIVVDENGEAYVAGLDNDAPYYLQEEKAPEGYTMLKDRKEVIMDKTLSAYQPVKVENKSGLVLPSTGGIGTTIFYIIGGLLIVAAVAFFVVRRKADAE